MISKGGWQGQRGRRKPSPSSPNGFATPGWRADRAGGTYLDPFEVAAKSAPKAFVAGPQGEFLAQAARLGGFTSHNVVGVARGRRPDGKAVLLMAHWDHIGICAPKAADKVCNGAVDNGSGVAAMIAIAGQVAKLGLDRDVWSLPQRRGMGATRARAFADRPPLPLASIVAGFNLDMIAVAPAGARVAMLRRSIRA